MAKPVLDWETNPRPREILRHLPQLYERAHDERKSLTQFLEDNHPSHEENNEEDRALGAFGRVMRASGFRFVSDPRERMWADTFEKIALDDEGRALIPEWGKHVWNDAVYGRYTPQVRPGGQRILEATESLLGSPLRPYVEAAGAYQIELNPPFSLADIVAFEQAIDADTWRRVYMTKPDAADVRMLRIGEAGDIPLSRIVTSDHTNRLYKYGRGIEITYEAQRRVPIDKVGYFIAQAALQVESDRIAQAIDVVLNGDGNANTAAENFNQSTLDTGTAPTIKGLLAFKSKWQPPYSPNIFFGREATLLSLMMLQMPNQNPFLLQIQDAMGFGGIRLAQERYGANIVLAQTDAVAAGVVLGMDGSRTLERTTEIGSDIEETKAYVERQTNALFFTQNDGYSILDENAAKTWTTTA
jgi:hypothetical protein